MVQPENFDFPLAVPFTHLVDIGPASAGGDVGPKPDGFSIVDCDLSTASAAPGAISATPTTATIHN